MLLTDESGLGGVSVRGEITSDPGFVSVDAISLESCDTLTESGIDKLAFDIRTGNPWSDRFDFIAADNDGLCVQLDFVSDSQTVFVGPNRTPAPDGRFNPVTLEPCEDTGNPGCGNPNIDASTDVALFSWVDCDGQLHMYITDGQNSATYTGRIPHIPLGSTHSISVEQGRIMYYVWMDFFLDKKGEEWLQTHNVDASSTVSK